MSSKCLVGGIWGKGPFKRFGPEKSSCSAREWIQIGKNEFKNLATQWHGVDWSGEIPFWKRETTRDISKNDPVVKSWGTQKDYFIEQNFEMIHWAEAQKILLKHPLKGGKQYHPGWLTIVCVSGEKFLTRQPEMDAYLHFAKANSLELAGFGTD